MKTLNIKASIIPLFFIASGLMQHGISYADENAFRVDEHVKEATLLSITHGVITGDVTDDSAIIWARADASAVMHVQLKRTKTNKSQIKTIQVNAQRNFTGKIKFNKLHDDSDYEYSVWFSDAKDDDTQSNKVNGSFHTAPSKYKARALSFAWGGDLAGQNVCRDTEEGFPIFNAISDMNLDFFIGLGDMIYADGTCTETGKYGNQQVIGDYQKSADMENYWGHWKYNLADESYQKLLSSTAYYAIWDDHEVVNDFGPLHDTRTAAPYTAGKHLLPMGLQAFLDFNPVDESKDEPKRLYRTIRWGKHFELFVLDTRQYRDSNLENDDKNLTKTMLGREQLTWLKNKLKSSDATWKMIVSSVPISIPTGYPVKNGRDGWSGFDQATGFEYELKNLFTFMRDEGINNSIWVTTDVHFAEVFRYTPFTSTPDFKVHEFVTGPLNAGLFPNRDFDTSWGTESLFFYGPQSMSSTKDYEEAKTWLNYGAVNIDENGVLTISVRDIKGDALYEQTMYPE
jgi:alkaline phosphatase D